ncbi:hypothetical protein [Desulfosporosinus burensis]
MGQGTERKLGTVLGLNSGGRHIDVHCLVLGVALTEVAILLT